MQFTIFVLCARSSNNVCAKKSAQAECLQVVSYTDKQTIISPKQYMDALFTELCLHMQVVFCSMLSKHLILRRLSTEIIQLLLEFIASYLSKMGSTVLLSYLSCATTHD